MEIAVAIVEEAPDITQSPHPDLDLSLFDPFHKLVQIEALGQNFKVPENNTLLRCFQYIAFETISYGGFCWNGTCRQCEVKYDLGDGRERQCLACCTKVIAGIRITETHPEVSFE